MSLTIGIVANEPSGDQLGALLVRAIRERLPEAQFVGVAGPRMQALGCESLFPMERLSVMGLVEVVSVLPELLRLRRQLVEYFSKHPPDVFIGVDAPDFNLGLERQLRVQGIPTAHMVSPTVWAWRPGRVRKIRRSVDLMLSIFPFEQDFLRQHRVPVRYIGHPLADEIALEVDSEEARDALGLPQNLPVMALLPGSRASEVERLAETMLETARWCRQERPQLRFVVPMANESLFHQFETIRDRVAPELNLLLLQGRAREAIAASDVVLTASGTATLETLLINRPMVVTYRIHPLTYALVKALRLIRVPHVAMANLLVGQPLAPEFLQSRARADLMGPALLALLDDGARRAAIMSEYLKTHRLLRRDAAREAADAVLELMAGVLP